MITKFKIFESIRDKMVPKSKDEIFKAIGKKDDKNRIYQKAWGYIKNEIEDLYPDANFDVEGTVNTIRYYITDKYDDEDNLKAIKKIIDGYGVECTLGSYYGHSTVKITVRK